MSGIGLTVKHKSGWLKIGPAVEKALAEAVAVTASAIQTGAKKRIETGPKSGRVYKRGKRPAHQASAPGEAPASDTAQLVNSIHTRRVKKLHRNVEVGSEHAAPLELGTTRIAARPYLTPATEAEREPFEKRCRAALGKGAHAGQVK